MVDHIKNVGNGITNVAVDLAISQVSNGHKSYIFGCDGDFKALLNDNEVGFLSDDSKSIYASSARLRKALDDLEFDIIHIHTPRLALVYLLYSIINFRKNNVVTTIHNSFQRSSWILATFNNVVCLSSSDVNKYSRYMRNSKFHKVINGTLGTKRQAGEIVNNPKRNNGSILITTVANMCHRKGIDILLRVFKDICLKHANVELKLIGAGEDLEKYKILSSDLDIDSKASFLGKLPNPNEVVRECDIFVLASRKDPCPLVVFEAMSCDVAIVGSNVDGIPEQLGYGAYGCIFNEEKNLYEVLDTLISNKNVLADYKKRAATGLHEFNLANTSKSYAEIYRGMLNDC